MIGQLDPRDDHIKGSDTLSILIRQSLSHRGWVEVPSTGYSMYPFIRPGDICRFEVVQGEQLRAGCVLLFRSRGRLIGHRLLQMESGSPDGLTRLTCKGDTNYLPDPTAEWEDVVGVLTSIRRRNRTIRMSNVTIRGWSTLILCLPLYTHWMRRYLAWKKPDVQNPGLGRGEG